MIVIADKDLKTRISGMLMARPTGHVFEDGRKNVVLFGMVAVPDGVELEEGHQYVLVGNKDGVFCLSLDSFIDRSEEARGLTPSQLLCKPIWRV